MKKFLLGTVAVLAMAASASAADLGTAARPVYTKAAPMMAAVYDWTGFYIGASAGYGWGQTRFQFNLAGAPNANHSTDGALAGGQIGYNWQSGAWVFGLEADGHWADMKGSTRCSNPAFVCSSDTRTLASFRGRVGYAASNWMFYGTGGAGYADTRYHAVGGFNSDSWGYTAGAGIEWGFSPNWSAKVEYLHYGFDRTTAAAGTLASDASASLRPDIDTVKVGINYRWGGPIVARY